jgi:uncharacterized protein (DUF2336 family)
MGVAQNIVMTDGTAKEDADGVLSLVRTLPPEKRRIIAAELAKRTDAPRALMRFLAFDEIVIATPVILESPVLTEDDLLEIARLGSPVHVDRLRQRENLSEKVRALWESQKPAEPTLMNSLRARRFQEFRALFIQLAGNQAAIALEALGHGKVEPLAQACKKAGLSRAAYSSIILLSDIGRKRPQATTMAMLEAFETANAA